MISRVDHPECFGSHPRCPSFYGSALYRSRHSVHRKATPPLYIHGSSRIRKRSCIFGLTPCWTPGHIRAFRNLDRSRSHLQRPSTLASPWSETSARYWSNWAWPNTVRHSLMKVSIAGRLCRTSPSPICECDLLCCRRTGTDHCIGRRWM